MTTHCGLRLYWTLVTSFIMLFELLQCCEALRASSYLPYGATRSLRFLGLCARILGHFAPSGFVLCTRILSRLVLSGFTLASCSLCSCILRFTLTKIKKKCVSIDSKCSETRRTAKKNIPPITLYALAKRNLTYPMSLPRSKRSVHAKFHTDWTKTVSASGIQANKQILSCSKGYPNIFAA